MQSCMVHNSVNWTLKLVCETYHKVHAKMAHVYNVRWAFNAKAWEPTHDQINAASSFIQSEEKQRIARFVYQDDAKSSLIGRLMLRKYVHISSGIPYKDIRFTRDDHGKPYMIGAGDSLVRYNVSHQGDYVVLGGHNVCSVGIDVMKVEPPPNKNIQEFFRLMIRQFSHEEWQQIRRFPTEMEQIACFYRMWCLKESYVKNIGTGITVPLNKISFSLNTLKLRVGELVTDTVLHKDSVRKGWVFEETLLDDKHVVAVSLPFNKGNSYEPVPYKFLSFDELVEEAKPLVEPDLSFMNDFMKKTIKPF